MITLFTVLSDPFLLLKLLIAKLNLFDKVPLGQKSRDFVFKEIFISAAEAVKKIRRRILLQTCPCSKMEKSAKNS